jgi:methyltransferase
VVTGSQTFFLVLLALVGAERIAELAVSKIHARLAIERGGSYVEPAGAYAAMVVVHALFLPAAAAEAILLGRPFLPALAVVATLAVLAAEVLRWWAVATLGVRWNTRPMVIPGAPVATGGPYRYVRHPNYVAVTIEMAALPLVHTAWITAIVWSLANAVLLARRIPREEAALERAGNYRDEMESRNRFLPGGGR